MPLRKRILWPLGMGLTGALALLAVYFALVSLLESPQHALDLFRQDWSLVVPLVLGFGIQVGLYTILKKRLFVPVGNTGPSGALTGASGSTSALAMAACCAHHVADVLPVLGLSAAAAFLAQYKVAFMQFGFGTTLLGIAVMLVILYRARREAIAHFKQCMENG